MTTIRVRDIIDVAETDHAHARSETVPSAVDILSRSAEATVATDAAEVIDMTDAHSVLRERESNGGRVAQEQPNARDAESEAESVLDMTDGALAEAAVNAGRSR